MNKKKVYCCKCAFFSNYIEIGKWCSFKKTVKTKGEEKAIAPYKKEQPHPFPEMHNKKNDCKDYKNRWLWFRS